MRKALGLASDPEALATRSGCHTAGVTGPADHDGGHQRGGGSEGDILPPHPPSETTVRRSRLMLVVGPLIAMVVLTQVGHALAPTLVTENPALLLALNSQNRYLILTSGQLDPLPYFLIGGLRLLAPDPFFYLLGYWYGDAAIHWMEHRTPTFGDLMRRLERAFTKAAYPLVVILPNNPVCLLAGASWMPPLVFAVLNVTGTVGRLLLLRLLGDALQNPIDWLLNQIRTYRVPLTLASIAIVGVVALREWRRGSGELEQLLEIEEDLEEELEEYGEGS